jgi:hypothetical protein
MLAVLVAFPAIVLVACGGGGGGGGGNGGNSSSVTSTKETLNAVAIGAKKNDNTAVLSYFVPTAQNKYQKIFTDNKYLSRLEESLPKAELVSISENKATYRSTFTDNGITYAYFIYLIKDSDGNWKLDEF